VQGLAQLVATKADLAGVAGDSCPQFSRYASRNAAKQALAVKCFFSAGTEQCW
jgi:hypothetical protein